MTEDKYIERLSKENPDIHLIGKYQGMNVKTKHFCSKHSVYWDARPSKVVNGRGCSLCAKENRSKSRKKTHNQYVKDVEAISPFIKVMGEYINSGTPIAHFCTKHGVKWNARPYNILDGKGCPECKKERSHSAQAITPVQYRERLSVVNPKAIPIQDYINANTPIDHYHIDCGHVTKMTPTRALLGAGCVYCKGKKIAAATSKSTVEYVAEVANVNPNIKITGHYVNIMTNIQCTCNVCGHIWFARPGHLLAGHGCPNCNEPIGERKIRLFLERNGIEYIRGKRFKGLVGIGEKLLSFDFYIPAYRLLIEFQGEQHERPVEMFGGMESFEKQLEHDRRKKNYALTHGYVFLEIFYKDIDRIDDILKDFLNTLKLETVTTTGVV